MFLQELVKTIIFIIITVQIRCFYNAEQVSASVDQHEKVKNICERHHHKVLIKVKNSESQLTNKYKIHTHMVMNVYNRNGRISRYKKIKLQNTVVHRIIKTMTFYKIIYLLYVIFQFYVISCISVHNVYLYYLLVYILKQIIMKYVT